MARAVGGKPGLDGLGRARRDGELAKREWVTGERLAGGQKCSLSQEAQGLLATVTRTFLGNLGGKHRAAGPGMNGR